MTSALLKTFDRICIIVRAGADAPQPALSQELRALGIDPDGERVRCVRVAAVAVGAQGGFPTPLACERFLGHLEALSQAQRDGVQRVLVVEDDVAFTPVLREADGLTFALHGDNWHLAYLGHELVPEAPPVDWLCSGELLQSSRCYAVAAGALPTVTVHLHNCLLRPAGHPEGGPMPVGAALSLLRRLEPALVTIRTSISLAARRDAAAPAGHAPRRRHGVRAGLLAGWRRLSGAA
ncbi:hypothetical protein [Azohydromonas aeria]|uniref:hypothetical protein n=1 Tax=Azohydromonas aeria TaxID=2590212 RepID=UPI0012FB55E6|nr:hypothetical protein [Azohydromonas aeria]